MNHLNKLISKDLVIGLPKLKFEKDHICEACLKGKQVKNSFKIKKVVSSLKPLELLHMDLFGPSRTMSLSGNYYALVIVDDFSRFTWALFLESKSDAFSAFKKLARRLQNTKNNNIGSIRSDHGGEFQNEKFSKFCEKMGILHNFSAPRTPQQNGVMERKNRSLEELARTMLSESSLPKYFWVDVVSTSCYVMNRVLIRPILKRTPYELFNERKPNINHLRVFSCSYFILNNGKENLGKFDEKDDHGIFIGYSLNIHAYRIYNKRLMTVEESVHVVFDEVDRKSIQISKNSDEEDEQNIGLEKLDICAEKQPVDCSKQPIEIMQQSELPKEWRIPRDMSVENIIGQIKEGVSRRSSISNFCRHAAFVSQIEPNSIEEALKDEKWVEAMHEELNQFARNEVWFLIPKTAEMNIIGSKWVFRNKLDEDDIITRNKASLVAKGYNQEEGIDYGKPLLLLQDWKL